MACAEYCGHTEEEHITGKVLRRCMKCPCFERVPPANGSQSAVIQQLTEISDSAKRFVGALIGQELKNDALDRAEESHTSDLQAARIIRDRIAFERGEVSADDVREVFEKHRGVNAWGPWAGALFRGGEYEPTGEFKASVFATNHGAVIRVWRRKAS